MVQIVFIEPSGRQRSLDVAEGWTLMQAARAKGVEGIEAECGGSCACATCHVYLEGDAVSAVPGPAALEHEMLESVAADRKPNSRLSCQVKISGALSGLVVRIPQMQ